MKLRKVKQKRQQLMAGVVENAMWQRRIAAMMSKWHDDNEPRMQILQQEWSDNLLKTLKHFTDPVSLQSLLDAKTEHDRKMAELLEPVDQE